MLSPPVYRGPTMLEMVKSFHAIKEKGVRNLRLGNLGVFVKTNNDLEFLEKTLGPKFH